MYAPSRAYGRSRSSYLDGSQLTELALMSAATGVWVQTAVRLLLAVA